MIKDNKDLFDIFVAKQEYGGERDEHGRFLYRFSNYKNVLRPVCSEYLIKKGFHIDWPDGHKFAACLTHDVDSIYPSWKYTLFTATKFSLNLRFNEGLERLVSKLEKSKLSNPYWNFKKILKLEERYGAKSSFYFKTTSRDPIGWTYKIEDLKDDLRYIADMSWEIGLHGGYYSYNDPEELKKEKESLEKVLGKKVIGIRMHYLRFKVPDTWRLLADLDFKYDTTFGYPDMVGYRNGMCHPFEPYDLETEKEIDILEIPLTVMDGTLFGSMRLHPGFAWRIVKKLIEVTERNRGVITILWHNNIFDKIFWGKWAEFYEQILKYLKERNAWMTSAEDIYKFWISCR